MAVVPLSGSNVFFLKGVPFSNDMKHTRWFDSKSQQVSYFESRPVVHAMDEVSFVQNDDKAYVRADASIDSLRDVSYMMFTNTQYSNKVFYAFVTDLKRKANTMTEVYFQIDVLQTWMFDIDIKPSFVVREHCPLWNPDGSPIINTIDEGLDYGTEYDDVYLNHFIPNNGIKFMVVISKQVMHTTKRESVSSYAGIAQPLSYYVLPITIDGDIINIADGEGDSIPMASPEKFLTEVYKLEDATKNIVSIYITESIGCPINVAGGGESAYVISFTEKDHKVKPVRIGEGDKVLNMLYVEDVKRFKTETFTLFGKYDDLPSYKESKLYMYPYTMLVVDDFKSSRTNYKLEYINQANINLNIKGSLGTANKVSYSIQDYNNKTESTNHLDNQYGIINNVPQDVAVITDLLAAYLQGNRNSLENQKNSIMFNGAMDMVDGALYGVGSAMNANPVGAGLGGSQVIRGGVNTQLQLEGMEAKKRDIANTPPQLAKMGSNMSYDMGHRYDGVTFIKKTIKGEYRRKLEDYFGMFGYKKHEVKMPNLHTRKNWNYIETKSCNIVGDFNTEDLNEIKSIFDGGITLWHTNDMMNYGLENGVI